MNPAVIPYISLAIAAGILLWGTVTLIQRVRHVQKRPPLIKASNAWITIRPRATAGVAESEAEKPNPLLDAYLNGQQSGSTHKSKKPR